MQSIPVLTELGMLAAEDISDYLPRQVTIESLAFRVRECSSVINIASTMRIADY